MDPKTQPEAVTPSKEQISDIKKGSRVRAHWYQAQTNPPASLAGMQLKFGATERDIIGTIMHIWGDHPMNPTKYEIAIQPDEGGDEVVVRPSWIVEVIKP